MPKLPYEFVNMGLQLQWLRGPGLFVPVEGPDCEGDVAMRDRLNALHDALDTALGWMADHPRREIGRAADVKRFNDDRKTILKLLGYKEETPTCAKVNTPSGSPSVSPDASASTSTAKPL